MEVEKANGFEKDPFYKNGILFVGTKGNLWFTHHGGYHFMPRSAGWCIPRVDSNAHAGAARRDVVLSVQGK